MPSLEELTVPELLAETKRLQESSRLFNTLLGDPSTREDALRLVKRVDPKRPIPELDTKLAAEASLATERAEREKLETRVREGEIRERIRNERERVMRDHDLSESEVLEVEKLMVDEKAPIPHYDAAAKVFKASRSQATPTSAQLVPKLYDMPEKGVWGAGVGSRMGLDKVFKEQAYAALNDVRKGGRAA